ncbi:ABC transporter ATP-binding protein [Massilia sp. W12]|uniref:ABC transporter ATP-binding protein n=1 Tax=Massilia sp. W12 TaxID=3126507 RepID=UPI0030CEE1FB
MIQADEINETPNVEKIASSGNRAGAVMDSSDPSVPCLEVVNTSISYGDFIALDGVDLKIQSGEIVGILGPNGAGKSTLIRACEGLEKIDQGRILLLGKDISVERKALEGRIGVVLQRPKFSSYATVRETIDLFRSFRACGSEPERLTEALGLNSKLDVKISKLSGGERQRLAVLIGLMGRHELILLDEPTSELDPQARRVVWQLISQVARQHNSAILMTTHQMEEAEVLCDRVYIIDHGKIIASGNPAQVIFDNCEEMSVLVTIQADAMEAVGAAYPNIASTRHGQFIKCHIKVAAVEEGQKLMRELLERFGSAVVDVGLQRSNLEDVFIKLTGAHLRD